MGYPQLCAAWATASSHSKRVSCEWISPLCEKFPCWCFPILIWGSGKGETEHGLSLMGGGCGEISPWSRESLPIAVAMLEIFWRNPLEKGLQGFAMDFHVPHFNSLSFEVIMSICHLNVIDREEMFGGSSWEPCVEGEHRMTLQPVPHDLCIHCTHPQHSGAALLLLMENWINHGGHKKTQRVHKCLWNKLECKLPLAQSCCWSGNDKQSRPCLKMLARFLRSSPMSANPFAACKVH